MAGTVDDLLAFQKARAAAQAIFAILDRPALRKDFALREQLNRACISVVSNIAEGFCQKSDAHFAQFLFHSRGSADEIRAQLLIAADRGYLDADECADLRERLAEVCRILTGLIRHLQRSNWKDRRR